MCVILHKHPKNHKAIKYLSVCAIMSTLLLNNLMNHMNAVCSQLLRLYAKVT